MDFNLGAAGTLPTQALTREPPTETVQLPQSPLSGGDGRAGMEGGGVGQFGRGGLEGGDVNNRWSAVGCTYSKATYWGTFVYVEATFV
jgi:hypothetical protein